MSRDVLYDSLWDQVANFLDCQELSRLCQCKPFLQGKLYQAKRWKLNENIPMKAYPHVRFLFLEGIPNKPIPPNVNTVSVRVRKISTMFIEFPNSVDTLALSCGDYLENWPINLKKLRLFYYKTSILLPTTLTSCIFVEWSPSVKHMIINTKWNDQMKFAIIHFVKFNEIFQVEICEKPNIGSVFIPLKTDNNDNRFYVATSCQNCKELCMCKQWMILQVLSLQKFQQTLLEAKIPFQ
jgi:hypothetical protein